MQYTISSDNLHVKSSFEIRKKDFERELLAIRAKHPDSLVWSRSIWSHPSAPEILRNGGLFKG